jgi:hypothetical protein
MPTSRQAGQKEGQQLLKIKVMEDSKFITMAVCAYRDEEVDWSQLKPESIVSANDPDIDFHFWKMGNVCLQLSQIQ